MFKKRKKLKIISLLIFSLWIIFAQSCMRMRMTDEAGKKNFEQKKLTPTFCYLPIGDIKMHYAKIGNDSLPTLFFIHGSPGSWDAFIRYMQDSALLAKYRMISIDRPGFGYSNFGEAENLQDNASDIFEVIKKEMNTAPFHLIGHSIGGPVVIKIAQNHPENFASLTILAGSISPFEEPKEKWRWLFKYTPARYLLPGALLPSNDEIYYFKKELYGLDSNYNKITMPVMLIHGSKDQFVSIKNVAYAQQKLRENKHIDTIIIASANHFIPWQHYDIIKKHLLNLSNK